MNYPDDIPSVETITLTDPAQIQAAIAGRITPLLMLGVAASWPMIEAARARQLASYLQPFDRGHPLVVFRGHESMQGRVFYNESLSGFNFERGTGQLTPTLQALEASDQTKETCYVGSSSVDYHLPGLRLENDLGLVDCQPLVSLWFGNQTRIAAHFDLPENLACVVAGRRRFTLFPPNQTANLYPGPLDFTPAGQAISLVDFYAPDHQQFPRYKNALQAAKVANMTAGDVLYIPSMWWHQVEGLDNVNVLMNYWWRSTPTWTGLPQDALMHALLSVGSLPLTQREAWAELFNYYVVNREAVLEQLPKERQGLLATLDAETAKQLRGFLIDKLQKI